jgi:hypothetical protein
MKKPDIPDSAVATAEWVRNVRMVLQILLGRRGERIATLREVKLEAGLTTPTKAEHDALAQQVVLLQKKVNEVLALLQGE